MTPWRRQLVLAVVMALLAWGAISVVRPLPDRRAGEVLSGERVPTFERQDSLARGETLGGLLSRAGLPDSEATRAIEAAPSLDPRRLRAGLRVTVRGTEGARPSGITLHLAIDRLVHLTRTATGWVGREEVLPWRTDTLVVRGAIESTLYDAFAGADGDLPGPARAELAWNVADVYEYRLDLSRDLQPGDRFDVLVERRRGPAGAVRVGRVLAASYTSGRATLDAIRFEQADGRARYFDRAGKSLQSLFLRAPLQFRRISSVFGMRTHPILGIRRAHRGTDYSAPSGTPVRTIGDGVVVRVGWMSGFGNVVEVRHGNGFVSRYGHLRGFAAGVRGGTRVGIGQTIGFVGMTGLASGPHLHFEVLVGGVQRNPRTALARSEGAPMAAAEWPAFQQVRDRLLARLQPSPAPVAPE